MNELDSLWTVAEISIAFAGFAVIASVLGEKTGGLLMAIRLRIGNLIVTTMGVMFLCLTSAALLHAELPEDHVWLTSSILLLLLVGGLTVRNMLTRRVLVGAGVAMPTGFAVLQVGIALLIIAMLIANLPTREFWLFFTALLMTLLNGAISFGVLVFYHLLAEE